MFEKLCHYQFDMSNNPLLSDRSISNSDCNMFENSIFVFLMVKGKRSDYFDVNCIKIEIIIFKESYSRGL